MADLEIKLSREIKADCTVIACRFPFPNWKETAAIGEGIDTVWVYKPNNDDPTSGIKDTLDQKIGTVKADQ